MASLFNKNGVRGVPASFTSNFPKGLESAILRGAARFNVSDDIMHCEDFSNMDDTQLALNYDITTFVDGAGAVALATNPGYLTLTTATTATNKAGLATMEEVYLPSKTPDREVKVTLASVESIEFYFGMYKDANEYAEIVFDASAGDNWLLKAHDGTTASAIDSGIAATTDETTLRVCIDDDGKAHGFINGVEFTTDDTAPDTTTDPMYGRVMVATEAAAAKVAKVRPWMDIQSK